MVKKSFKRKGILKYNNDTYLANLKLSTYVIQSLMNLAD